jgi:HSP20 family protein
MLLRFDPFREFPARPAMPMDAYRRDGQLVVHFDLPGVDSGSIDLTVEKNVLTVTAERRYAKAEGDEIVVSERPQGRFARRLLLGDSLDPEGIEAAYDHGVLSLTVPVAEKAKARKIAVNTGSAGDPALEAQAA